MERLDEWMLEPLELEQKAPSLGNEFNISVAFLSLTQIYAGFFMLMAVEMKVNLKFY